MSKIKIISIQTSPNIEPIRGGGEEQSLIKNAAKKIGQSIEVSSDMVVDQIRDAVSTINSAIDKFQDTSKEFPIDEIKLGLAISADGNIGLVSAGAKATIEVKFKRKEGS
ncbi:CU044_2847 family protein [Reichenbachiella sp.]|uniref:CU044_2847 family protein n=1 Tax=Reichenbachiella sp. TaxID=2184521 RepID=UPI003BAEA83F